MRAFQQGSAPKILRIKGGGRNEVLWQMRSRGRGDADLQRGGMGLSQRAVRVQRHCLGGALGKHEQSVPRGAPSAFGRGKYYYEKIFGGSEWLGYPLNTLYYAFRDDGRFWEVEGQVDDRSSSYADVLYYAVRRYGHPQYGTTNNGYQKASWYGRDVNIALAKTYRGWRVTIAWRGPRVAPLSPPPHHDRRPEYSPPPPPPQRPERRPPPPPPGAHPEHRAPPPPYHI